MRVSIVTVALNSDRTIEKTLRSVAEQTWGNVEHIVVDGGSTDATVAVVQGSGRPGYRLLQGPDAGIYDAMNKGVAAATGDIIGFLNSDDHFAHPGVLDSITEAMTSDVDAVFGDLVYFHEDRPEKVVRRYDSSAFNPARLPRGIMPAHPTLYVRRSLFDRVGPFATGYRIAGDFEWVARAFTNQTVRYRYIPEVLVRMQVGGVSTQSWRSALVMNREILRACRANGVPASLMTILSRYPAKLLELFRPSATLSPGRRFQT